jgi:DNA polymerase-3 subunit gamma/tau
LLAGEVSQSLLILNEILGKGFDGQHILTGLANFFRDVLVCKDPQTLVLFEVGDAAKEKYRNMAQQCSDAFLYKALEWSNESDLNYRYSKNKRLLLELLLIRLCQLNQQSSPVADKKKITIEPLVPQEQTVLVEQKPTTPVQEKSIAEKPVAVKPVVSGPLAANSPLRRSIKPASDQPEAKAPETETKNPVLNESFTQEDLEKAWKNYAGKEEDAHLKNTMLNISPQLQANNRIRIAVFNPDQENKLRNKVEEIKSNLSGQLRNTQIELEILVTEDEKDYIPYGGRDIFKFMAEKNPAIVSLAKEFNLKLS